MGSAFLPTSILETFRPASHPLFQAPRGPCGVAGILDYVSTERSLWILPFSASVIGLFWTSEEGRLRALLRAVGAPGPSWGLVFGVRLQEAAVYAIINLRPLTGSGGAVASTCGARRRDWLREGGQERLGPLGHAGSGSISLSCSSHNIS